MKTNWKTCSSPDLNLHSSNWKSILYLPLAAVPCSGECVQYRVWQNKAHESVTVCASVSKDFVLFVLTTWAHLIPIKLVMFWNDTVTQSYTEMNQIREKCVQRGSNCCVTLSFSSFSFSIYLRGRAATRRPRIKRMCLRKRRVLPFWPSSTLRMFLEPLWSCRASANPKRWVQMHWGHPTATGCERSRLVLHLKPRLLSLVTVTLVWGHQGQDRSSFKSLATAMPSTFIMFYCWTWWTKASNYHLLFPLQASEKTTSKTTSECYTEAIYMHLF